MRTRICRKAVTLVCLAAVVALAALVAGCGGVNNSPTAGASGVVLNDQTLQPIVGAQVTLGGATTPSQATTGAFSFATAPAGAQTLTVTATGFQPTSVSVNIATGANALGAVYLKPVVPAGTGWITGKIIYNALPVGGGTVNTPTQSGLTKADGTYALYAVPVGETVTVFATDGLGHGAQLNVRVVDGQQTSGADMTLTNFPIL